MKIAMIGYGKMGHEIEKIAIQRGHSFNLTIDEFNPTDLNDQNLQKCDVAIDFTTPDAAYKNIMACFSAGIPVVSGTTGWLLKLDEIEKYCKEHNQTFLYASNFSLGVNLFFELNKNLAKLMNGFDDYSVSIEEIHHIHKKDAPSGTAITLAEDIIENIERLQKWELNTAKEPNTIPIQSIRENEVPGTHTIRYTSPVDTIEIKHEAKNRAGLALGAIVAAEFIHNKKGVFTMRDILKFK